MNRRKIANLTNNDLTITGVSYGAREVPWTLYPLLYAGGAAADARKVHDLIAEQKLGELKKERITLVTGLHEIIQGDIAAGGSRYNAKSRIRLLRDFYAWADKKSLSLTLESLKEDYVSWTDFLLHRHRTAGTLKPKTIAKQASRLATLFNQVLNLKNSLIFFTFIDTSFKRRPLGMQADKTNMEAAFNFGNMLLDLTESLSLETINGPLPAKLIFRTGHILEEWSGLMPAEKVKHLSGAKVQSNSKKRVIAARAAWSSNPTLRTRRPLINLRIQAELLIFIAQTQMNLAQAYRLTMGKFSYESHLDGYRVRRVYKDRRKGEVEFEIYSEYRSIFERYLQWRNDVFKNESNDLLFPLIPSQGRSPEVAPEFTAIKKKCSELDIHYFGPRTLRKIKINWLSRRLHDPDLTADMAQHTRQTLLRNYDQPHHQIALIEISRFHSLGEPIAHAPAPGLCVGTKPEHQRSFFNGAPPPDCISPAGCLYCAHHRDIDSADHVWSLTTYRYYKSLELSRYVPLGNESPPPPATVIDRITQKLQLFSAIDAKHATWVKEASERIDEGSYHPKWDGFIQLLENSL
ncbi:Site-specific integrase [Cupriavidus oxalaticus]|uniref:site-specific integrase n=1 Tax=Cupriavidus oxalaticus TaxID=96344 RepID=UPI003F7339ED